MEIKSRGKIAVKSVVIAILLLSPVVVTAPQNQLLAFEVATIKPSPQDRTTTIVFGGGSCHGTDRQYLQSPVPPPPLGRCIMSRVNLTTLLGLAYGVRVSGGPSWVSSDEFDVEGKAEDPSNATEAELLMMLQNLVSGRFRLQSHRELREVQAFSLYLAKNGPKSMTKSTGDDPPIVQFGGPKLTAKNATIAYFANSIRGMLGGAVADKTGLTGKYDFSFFWESGDPGAFLAALQADLGLRVESMKTSAEFIVIDHAEKPDAN
jgi:uncharacterized protein (TIGR03435 family)